MGKNEMSPEHIKVYSPIVQQKAEQLEAIIKVTATVEELLPISEKGWVEVEEKRREKGEPVSVIRIDKTGLVALQRMVRTLVDDLIDLGEVEIACDFYNLYRNRAKGVKLIKAEDEEKFDKIIGELK